MKKSIIFLGFFLVIFFILKLFGLFRFDSDVIYDGRRIIDSELPETWSHNNETEAKKHYSWTKSFIYPDNENFDLYTEKLLSLPNADNIIIVRFIDKNNDEIVTVVFTDFNNTFDSIWAYTFNDPSKTLKNFFWNFEYNEDERFIDAWTFNNKNVDSDLVLCGEGNKLDCSAWFYLARYEKHLMWIYAQTTGDYLYFEELVSKISNAIEE